MPRRPLNQRTQVHTLTQKTTAPEDMPDGLYGLAMLKLALALKKQPKVPVAQLVSKTLEDLGLSQAGFHRYLEERGQGLDELLMGRGLKEEE
ncbi:MAG: hypothetical protein FWD46_05485 [Cystobacterineae bacterium]|nr:hypothetical protein [Cystobacterineae bacterium]